MQSAIRFHLEGLKAEGRRVPSPRSFSTYVDIPAWATASTAWSS